MKKSEKIELEAQKKIQNQDKIKVGREEISKDDYLKEIGESIRIRLDSRSKKEPDSPMPYRSIFSNCGLVAKKLGYLSVTQLSDKLEELGYVFIFEVPSTARYVFSGNCKLDHDEMLVRVYDIEHEKHQQKMTDKILKKYPNG